MAVTVDLWADHVVVNADTGVRIHVAGSSCLPFVGCQA